MSLQKTKERDKERERELKKRNEEEDRGGYRISLKKDEGRAVKVDI